MTRIRFNAIIIPIVLFMANSLLSMQTAAMTARLSPSNQPLIGRGPLRAVGVGVVAAYTYFALVKPNLKYVLAWAIDSENLSVVRFCLARGVNPSDALIEACIKGNLAIVQELVKHGANVNRVGVSGATSLAIIFDFIYGSSQTYVFRTQEQKCSLYSPIFNYLVQNGANLLPLLNNTSFLGRLHTCLAQPPRLTRLSLNERTALEGMRITLLTRYTQESLTQLCVQENLNFEELSHLALTGLPLQPHTHLFERTAG